MLHLPVGSILHEYRQYRNTYTWYSEYVFNIHGFLLIRNKLFRIVFKKYILSRNKNEIKYTFIIVFVYKIRPVF